MTTGADDRPEGGAQVPVPAWPDGLELGAPEAILRLRDGLEHRSANWERSGDRWRAACGPLNLELAVENESVGLKRFRLRAVARESCEVTEVGLGFRPRLAGVEPTWVIYNGYQSWDAAGVAPAPAIPAADPDTGAGAAAGTPLPHRESWWTVGVASEPGNGIALAAESAQVATWRFDVLAGGELLALAGEFPGLERRPLLWSAPPGGCMELDDLVAVAGNDVQAALVEVAGPARRPAGQAAGAPASRPPRGWLSWYHYGPWVDAPVVLANSEALASGPLAGLGYSVVQVDDGWQQAYGDWVANSKFPGGLASLAAGVAERGQILGVWTAPFLVSVGSDLARHAPEAWFVRDPATGERATDPVHLVFGPMQILDARNPEVLGHLRSTFARLREEGVRYFKIDFLYAGAYAGTAAFRAGLEAIRGGAGDDAYLLACGAPLLPVVGICDGCRVGQDSASPIFDFELGAPQATLMGDELFNVGRNQAARHFLGAWFELDPDIALVGGKLELEQGRMLVTVCAMAGGPFFSSDDLLALGPERLDLLRNTGVLELAASGGAPAVPDWQPHPKGRAPAVWRRGDHVAVFNWGWKPGEVTLDIPPGHRLVDVWNGHPEAASTSRGGPARVDIELGACGSRLFRLEPV